MIMLFEVDIRLTAPCTVSFCEDTVRSVGVACNQSITGRKADLGHHLLYPCYSYCYHR